MRSFLSCLTATLIALLGVAPASAQTFAPEDRQQRHDAEDAMPGYGNAVAVSGGTVFVGEPNNKYNPGAVYLYQREGGEWTRTGKLTAEDADPNDGFGNALAARGDYLLVGASKQSGAAYVFQNTPDGYEQVARLAPDGEPEAGEGFGGGGVAIGSGWAAVGAPGASNGDLGGAGAAYLFRRSDDSWTQTDRLTGSAADSSSGFGAALDYEKGRLLVGAPGAGPRDPEGPPGTAYLFARQNGEWTEAGMAEGPGSESGPTGFGASASLHGGRAFVGAPLAGGNTGMVGVYAISEDGSGWQPAGELHPFDGGQRHFFGIDLAHTAGETWVSALGAKRLSGRVYAFSESEDPEGEWTSSREVVTGEQAQDLLGRAIAADGDVAAVSAQSDGGRVTIFGRSGPGAGSEWIARAKDLKGDPGGLPAVTGDTKNCEDGRAAGRYNCNDVQLLSFLPIDRLGGEQGVNLNDVWGWNDPQTGTPYALVGRTDGMAFVDISNPQNPVYVGELPLTEGANPNSWRDAKVYEDHVFVVADNAGDHGMQVFDLTRLREHEAGDDPITYEADMVYDRVNSAHNIVMNKETGYAYIVGAGGGGKTCGGGLHMVNVQQPNRPTFAGCFADERTGRKGTGYSHDAQCLVYDGPDEEHKGDEICFGANETALSIADVTDKENPKALAAAEYPKSAYTHQGWIDENHRYFYLNDELDELQGKVDSTRTLIWDVSDLEDPQLVKQYTYGTTSSDHNLYVEGNRMYMSNYASGLRVHDISDPENPKEIAHFDTSPVGDTDPPGFTGTWSNYPYFENGVVAVSSIGEGLFLLKPQLEERESL
jgi:choice-of-anchor B domain-containing protein